MMLSLLRSTPRLSPTGSKRTCFSSLVIPMKLELMKYYIIQQ